MNICVPVFLWIYVFSSLGYISRSGAVCSYGNSYFVFVIVASDSVILKILYLFLAVLGLCCCADFSLVAAIRATLSLWCVGFSLRWWLLVRSLGFRARGLGSCDSWALNTGSVVVAHGLSCSAACGIFLDQELNSCLLHWQADSLPLSQVSGYQGSLVLYFQSFEELSECFSGTSLVVQWLRLRAPNAGGTGSIPGWGTRSHTLQWKLPHMATKTWHS